MVSNRVVGHDGCTRMEFFSFCFRRFGFIGVDVDVEIVSSWDT